MAGSERFESTSRSQRQAVMKLGAGGAKSMFALFVSSLGTGSGTAGHRYVWLLTDPHRSSHIFNTASIAPHSSGFDLVYW